MPARSAVEQLPDAVRRELERRLVAQGFGGYEDLAAWLQEQGFGISKSAIHRHGQRFEDRLAKLRLATSQAQAVVAASPDDEGAVNEALVRLTQERLFGILLDLPEMEDGEATKVMPKLTRAIADLTRASVVTKRFTEEVRAKARAAADKVEAVARKGGLSAESVDAIRREILGIAGS